MDKSELYFIALVPHEKLRNEIRAIKERMRSEYGAGHALKSPAHITLQMPFKRDGRDEPEISAALRRFAFGEESFTIDLDGYGCFAPRVIFIRITNPEPVRALHRRLKQVLAGELQFPKGEIMNDVQPHITVATRDLTKESFADAWPEMKDEEFRGSFQVHSLILLKHNGKNWDILEEFPFGKNG
jgi:2'-5' RNA ligase